jgi:hypothetical protein
MATKIDNHQFYIDSKKLEASVAQEAYEKAKTYQDQNLPSWKANSIAKDLGKQAYENYKNRISQQFESESYKVLISLLLKSRISFFGHSLPESLKVVILKTKTGE